MASSFCLLRWRLLRIIVIILLACTLLYSWIGLDVQGFASSSILTARVKNSYLPYSDHHCPSSGLLRDVVKKHNHDRESWVVLSAAKGTPPTIFSKEKLSEIENDVVALEDLIERLTTKIVATVDLDQRDVLAELKGRAQLHVEQCKQSKMETPTADIVELGTEVEAIRDDFNALSEFLKKLDATMKNLDKNESIEYVLLKKLAESYLMNSKPSTGSTLRSNRVAEIDFQVESTALKHAYDLERIKEYVMSLFDWHTDKDVRDKYMAPYFPLVQSSGMGKTKLLWELRESINNNKLGQFADFDCKTILCGVGPPDPKKRRLFSDYLEANRFEGDTYRRALTNVLDDNLHASKKNKVIFLFDETQHLLQYDGFAFRCVRWWLRLVRPEKQVVAVFTGTTSRLTNFYAEPRLSTTSRDASLSYYTKGDVLYDPFYDLYTIGIFADDPSMSHGETEYDRAIPHGRPLFALMHEQGDFTDSKLINILDRMLLNSVSNPWETNLASFVSILATRIQMGPTSVSLAAELVSRGYAMLTYYAVTEPKAQSDRNIARIGFATDPVCSRLAMAMMDEDWSILSEGDGFKGMSKKLWIRKMGEIFSTGLCLPNRGDLGELAAAIYLLFCGDLLRKRIDASYKTFSVPLTDFIDLLSPPQQADNHENRKLQSTHEPPLPNIDPQDDNNYEEGTLLSTQATPPSFIDAHIRHAPPQEADKHEESTVRSTEEPPLRYIDAHVSFIQLVRNYMRFTLEGLEFADILKNMYASGCAFYSHPLCKTYDMVASIRLTSPDKSFRYVPLLVSVTTERTSKSQIKDLQLMENLLKDANTTGLCIRLLFGWSKVYGKPDELLSSRDVNALLNGSIVSKVVIVPEKDPFDIVNQLLEITSAGPVKNEVHTSQYFLLSPKLLTNGFKYSKLLRTRPGKGATAMLKQVIDKKRVPPKKTKGTNKNSQKKGGSAKKDSQGMLKQVIEKNLVSPKTTKATKKKSQKSLNQAIDKPLSPKKAKGTKKNSPT
jgi:hypothetical protein